MARPGLSTEEIIAVAKELQAVGEKVTIQAVREKLGNRGSITTISKILKEWKEGMLGKENTATIPDAGQEQQSLDIAVPEPAISAMSVAAIQSEAPRQAVEPVSPSTEAVAGAEMPAQPQQERRFERRDHRERLGFKKRHDNQHHQHPRREHEEHRPIQNHQHDNQHQHSAPQTPKYTPEIYEAENLDALSDKELLVKIRRLEIYLNKEQSRREAAEKMAREAKEYAEVIKEQIGQRISDLRQAMEETINDLKAEARKLKDSAETDLRFYREQLDKANKKIISLLNNEEQK